MKTCSRCHVEKEENYFRVKNKKTGLLSAYCKLCNKEYQKKHYTNNKNTYQTKAKQHRKERKDFLQEFKKTLKCNRCDESEPICLDFHHIDSAKKDLSVSEAVKNAWSFERIKKEIEKCEILCANCHRKHHFYEKLNLISK